jgi:hypothetical protein
VKALDELLAALGANDFVNYLPVGRSDQAVIEELAEQQGIIGVPGYSIGEQVFVGREHLPLLRGLLGKAGADE